MTALLKRWWDSDLLWSWRHTPVAIIATLLLLVLLIASLGAHWVAPHNPFDLASINLIDALTPPVWMANGQWTYPLGTDSQGRDLYSTLLYGAQVSLLIGLAAVGLALVVGITLVCYLAMQAVGLMPSLCGSPMYSCHFPRYLSPY